MSTRGSAHGGSGSRDSPFVFVKHGSGKRGSPDQRRAVRTRAALASASTRKQTLAERGQRKDESHSSAPGFKTEFDSIEPESSLVRQSNTPYFDSATTSQDEVVQRLTHHLSELQLTQSLQPSSMPANALRTALWNGMVSSTVLFQASLFISSTYRNTAGLPWFMRLENISQIILKLGTVQIVNKNILSETGESLTPFAIAMLASWERQHGNRAEYDLHMQGWRSLPIINSSDTLNETNIAHLATLTLSAFRNALTERAFTTPLAPQSNTSYHAILPLGFWPFNISRPETRSLLDLATQLTLHVPSASDSVTSIRRIGLEISAWTPYHTHSSLPSPSIEASYPSAELTALYHIRAVCLQIAGMLLRVSVTAHGIHWPWNEKEALAIHTRTCRDMLTSSLLGTRFQEVGVWARFLMCACSEDPERDAFIRELLVRLNLRTWTGVREMLKRHVYIEYLHASRCEAFFERLMTRRSP